MHKITLLCATTALAMPAIAFAQSTGSITVEAEEEAIVVTGTRNADGVEGIVAPNSSKAKAVLTEEIIQRQTPGQSILDTINLVPGVSFQNNDPYGSAGGTLTIRGFDSSRVSLTFDGVPLNDSGNYAIFSNQQLDPELIEQVNVNLGTTDVDSPTASAAGGTVNYRTRLPQDTLGASVAASYGEFNFHRLFGSIDTGDITGLGTRAFVAASYARNDNVFNNFGQIYKQQYNARIVQDIGIDGDFISVAGHYNQNRNNFFGSVPLRNDTTLPNGAPLNVPNRFPQTRDERFYEIARCTTTVPRSGRADAANSCGSTFDERFNPSNTGNIRVGSRFTLTDRLALTVDPSYQYVKANGGGTVVAAEGGRDIQPGPGVTLAIGYIGGAPAAGRDLNGDGDALDTVRLLAPSNTNTHRIGVTTSLIYDITDDHLVRAAYTYDRARHRQTGEVGFLDQFGRPLDVFTQNDPITDANGDILQKRDRLSFAILHQVAGEYRGSFLDNRLDVNLGLRAPFFTRDLDQRCFTTSAGGFVDCFSGNAASEAAFAALNPNAAPPREVKLKYDKLLPNVGFTYELAPRTALFGNYAKGLSVPSTDNLYNSLFFTGDNAPRPAPETTDSFDLGARYTTGRVQAQVAGWYTKFENRIASSFDVELNQSVFRNLGTVDKWGFDGSVAFQPIPEVVLYAFGSYLDSEIQDDLVIGEAADGTPFIANTRGKREAGSPKYTFGGRAQAMVGPVELGVQAKRTGKRFVYDTNEPVLFLRAGAAPGAPGTLVEIFPAATPAYTLVDLDARLNLARFGMRGAYLQLNVTNLFDEVYAGGFGGGLNQNITRNAAGAITSFGSTPFVQIGAPRTVSGSLVVSF